MNLGAFAAIVGITLILADSYLTAGIRHAIVRPKIRIVLGCAQCVSFWVAAATSWILFRHGASVFDWTAFGAVAWGSIPLDAVACSGLCGILGRLVASGRPSAAPVSIPREVD